MESKNPTELIEKVQQEQQKRSELAADALQWFLDGNVQELFPRSDVVDKLCEELDITEKEANRAISDTVGDIVDPVQQVAKDDKRYVGIIDYRTFNDEGAYGYIDFDDRKGKRKRVVCARCVEKHRYDENIKQATEGEGSLRVNATWDKLLNKVTAHYAKSHTKAPSSIEPGASLLNGSTISGNTSWHNGNVSGNNGINISNTGVGVTGGTFGRVDDISFNNIEDLSADRAIGIDDSEGPMYKDSGGNTFPLWNSNYVNSSGAISISGGNGAGSTPITIGVSDNQIDAGSVDGFDIEKNGTDGNGTINFKT